MKSVGLTYLTKPGHLLKLSLACGALAELKPWALGFFLKRNYFLLEVSARLSYFAVCFIHGCRLLGILGVWYLGLDVE